MIAKKRKLFFSFLFLFSFLSTAGGGVTHGWVWWW